MTTAPRVAQAQALADRAQAALQAAGLTDVTTTIDPARAVNGARDGIVLVLAPTITWDTWTLTSEAWELQAIAGPAGDPLAAWTRLDRIVDALAAGLNVRDARPGSFSVKALDAPIPAYTIRLHTSD